MRPSVATSRSISCNNSSQLNLAALLSTQTSLKSKVGLIAAKTAAQVCTRSYKDEQALSGCHVVNAYILYLYRHVYLSYKYIFFRRTNSSRRLVLEGSENGCIRSSPFIGFLTNISGGKEEECTTG